MRYDALDKIIGGCGPGLLYDAMELFPELSPVIKPIAKYFFADKYEGTVAEAFVYAENHPTGEGCPHTASRFHCERCTLPRGHPSDRLSDDVDRWIATSATCRQVRKDQEMGEGASYITCQRAGFAIMRERKMRAAGTWYKNRPKADTGNWITMADLKNQEDPEPALQGEYPPPTRNGFDCSSFRDSQKLGFFTSRAQYVGRSDGKS